MQPGSLTRLPDGRSLSVRPDIEGHLPTETPESYQLGHPLWSTIQANHVSHFGERNREDNRDLFSSCFTEPFSSHLRRSNSACRGHRLRGGSTRCNHPLVPGRN